MTHLQGVDGRPALLVNPGWAADRPWPAQERWLDRRGCDAAVAELAGWPGYAPTALRSLDELAAGLDVSSLSYKDENGRFGLDSFKVLGAPYALASMVADRIQGRRVSTCALIEGAYRSEAAAITCAAATDGNHGRALAWAARRIGCRCVVYVHAQVSAGREAAIRGYGAEVVRVDGTYDDAVRRCAEDCRRLDWLEINDAGPAEDLRSTRLVMQGYCIIADEVLAQLEQPPSHVFLQAGVGGFAAAMAARLWQRWEASRCRLVVVEPLAAACLYASAEAGRLAPAAGHLDTLMAGLACGEASYLGWQILSRLAFGFLSIPDAAAIRAMRTLAGRAEPLVAGETGASGLAGAMVAAADPDLRRRLGIERDSRILVFGTEGATDPDLYARYVG